MLTKCSKSLNFCKIMSTIIMSPAENICRLAATNNLRNRLLLCGIHGKRFFCIVAIASLIACWRVCRFLERPATRRAFLFIFLQLQINYISVSVLYPLRLHLCSRLETRLLFACTALPTTQYNRLSQSWLFDGKSVLFR